MNDSLHSRKNKAHGKKNHAHDPKSFYLLRRDHFSEKLKDLEKQLKAIGLLRFALFVAALAWAYFIYLDPITLWSGLGLALVIFIFLVLQYQRIKAKKDLCSEYLRINQTEIDVLEGEFKSLDDGSAYACSDHHYNLDIDLFGKGSFFQYLNRSSTQAGRDHLAGLLNANEINDIDKRQETIRELSAQVEWRQEFSARAKLLHTESNPEEVRSWIENYQPVWNLRFRHLPRIFGSLSMIIFGLTLLKILPFSVLGFWFFLGLGLIGVYFKRIEGLYAHSGKAKDLFKQYHVLLDLIEKKDFSAELLRSKQRGIQTDKRKASEIVRAFSRTLDSFDQRNNKLMGFVINGLFLWDMAHCYKIERWIEAYQKQVVHWFDSLAFFDAFNSLGNFGFNHGQYTYPRLRAEIGLISARQLGHPMIIGHQRIDNDFEIENGDFHVITGANMAGKSTFLRTVSLAIVMANAGLPVCADSFSYRPVKLISSMRTVDSLSEDSSYFYAEIKRLKFIVDQLGNEPYFVVLDEILKGTNSKDKEIGSKKFLEKLLQTGSTGIIATHDLSLCVLSKQYPRVHNKFFDVVIEDERLQFDYLLRDGICTTMNASFLLKQMDIV